MTVRVEHIGLATLYFGDALELLPTIGGAHVAVTDPPYLVSKGGFASNLQLEGGFGGWMKDYGNQGDIVHCNVAFEQWAPLVFSALAEQAQAYFMTNGRNLKAMQGPRRLQAFGFTQSSFGISEPRCPINTTKT